MPSGSGSTSQRCLMGRRWRLKCMSQFISILEASPYFVATQYNLTALATVATAKTQTKTGGGCRRKGKAEPRLYSAYFTHRWHCRTSPAARGRLGQREQRPCHCLILQASLFPPSFSRKAVAA